MDQTVEFRQLRRLNALGDRLPPVPRHARFRFLFFRWDESALPTMTPRNQKSEYHVHPAKARSQKPVAPGGGA